MRTKDKIKKLQDPFILFTKYHRAYNAALESLVTRQVTAFNNKRWINEQNEEHWDQEDTYNRGCKVWKSTRAMEHFQAIYFARLARNDYGSNTDGKSYLANDH